ncbi:hypothetical protein ACVWZ6_000773 [Bradyrhizobium sp. GM6.1]
MTARATQRCAGLAQHQGLRIEPAALVEQASEAHAADAVLLDGVFVVDAGDEALIGDVQQRHTGRFIDAAALGLDDAVLDLVAHAEAVAAADGVSFEEQRDGIREGLAVQRDRLAFLETHHNLLGLDVAVVTPERHAHDRVDDLDAAVETFKILGLVRRAEQIAVGRIRLLGAHLVGKALRRHERRHLGAAAELVNELLVEPGLVDAQARIGQEAVAIEALDVVALEGRAVAPDVDAVLLHRRDQHRAGDGAPERRGVEIGDAAGRDMKGAGLDSGDAFVDELRAAIDQQRFLRAELHRLARDLVVIGLIRLAEIGGIGVAARALLLHPEQRRAGIEAARKSDADFLPLGQAFQDRGHGASNRSRRADVVSRVDRANIKFRGARHPFNGSN